MPPYSHIEYIEASACNVMGFGAKAFERSLGLDKVIRVSPHAGLSALIRGGTPELALSLSCGDTQRRWLSVSQGESLLQNPTLRTP